MMKPIDTTHHTTSAINAAFDAGPAHTLVGSLSIEMVATSTAEPSVGVIHVSAPPVEQWSTERRRAVRP